MGDAADSNTPRGVLEGEILDTMPKTMVHKSQQLLDKIKRVPGLSWDELSGQVSVDGDVIENSNLLDLVHDAIRPRKTAPDPAGWKDFADALVRGGVPIEYIHNPKRREYILNRRSQVVVKRKRQKSPVFFYSERILESPRPGQKRQKPRRPVNWEQIP